MSSVVAIFVFLDREEDRRTGLRGLRAATWTGVVGWPGAPSPGSPWMCCEDSSIETIERMSFNAPVPQGEPDLVIEVRATREKLGHLVSAHGFDGTVAE